jgi:hypothetical protein
MREVVPENRAQQQDHQQRRQGAHQREAEKQAELLRAQLVFLVGLFGDLFGRRVRRWMAQCRSSWRCGNRAQGV